VRPREPARSCDLKPIGKTAMPPALAAEQIDESPAGAGAKSASAFRTISEVAEELDVPQHVLRFWETRFGQIRPVKRAGGRRYYRPQDVELVAGIRHLLHVQRYTIAGAQRVLKENGVRFVQAVGRGEAVAAEPAFQEAEAEVGAGTGALEASDRAALAAALEELRACRALLDGLREIPDPEA
jgi:DNA-binding transcriptional MerR regulator